MQKILKYLSTLLIVLVTTRANTINVAPTLKDIDRLFLNEITIDSWAKPQSAETILQILTLFNSTMSDNLKNSTLWVNQAPSEKISKLISEEIKIPLHANGIYMHIPIMPFLAKWIIPQTDPVIIIGDLHGNIKGLEEIIRNMYKLKMFIQDGSMRLNKCIKMVFLGDYMDRGENSFKVFTTAALLALKNPGQVLMLRGNHEDIAFNLDAYNLKSEILMLGAPEQISQELITELSTSYELLPVGAFVGYQGIYPTKLIFHAHGAVDIRINCRDLLTANDSELSRNGGIKLWEFGRENIMSEQEIIAFYQDIIPNISDLTNTFKAEFSHPDPTIGLRWNDIAFKDEPLFNISQRGYGIMTINIDMVKKYLEKYNSYDTKICGLIRGHQHFLPKILYEQINPEIDETTLLKETPPCIVNFPDGNLLLKSTKSIQFDSDFGIATLISATIACGKDQPLEYPSAFLILSCNQEDGTYGIEALY